MAAIPKPTLPGPSATPAAVRARLLGVIAQHQRGEVAAAICGYREVLALDPRQFDALRLLGAALRTQGDPAQALAHFDRALAVRGDFAEVWHLRGQTLVELGRGAEAVASFERAVSLRPDFAPAWNALGLQQQAAGRHADALRSYDHALALGPGVAAYWSNRALALDALKRPAEALQHLERACALEPGTADIWLNHAKALNDQGRWDAALASLDRCLELDPALALAWCSRAAPLRSLGRLGDALAALERALQLDAQLAQGWSQRGGLLAELGRIEEARASFDRAVAIDPDDRMARFNLGLLLLTLGNFEAGWEHYEARDRVSGMVPGDAPIWQGSESLAGKTLALHCEQGLGDTLQFCRFAPLLVARGARVVLLVPAPLYRLLASLGDGIRVITTGDPVPPLDLQCDLMSVAHRLRTTPATIPCQVPYLHPTAARARHWQARLGLPGATDAMSAPAPARARRPLRVGLVFSGNAEHGNDRHRSIPLEQLAPWFESLPPGALQWHLLQRDVRAPDEAWLARLGIVDHRSALEDFCDTAALALCLDAVVSVDTSVAHLAGALGVPLFLLLPANPDWRWMLERTDSPWYPSARLLRQSTLGDWRTPLERLRTQLLEMAPRDDGRAHAAALLAAADWRDDAMLSELQGVARAAPSDPHDQFNLGLRYLALGRFDPGWDYYEWRQQVPALFTPMPDGGAFWDGSQELAGRTLLLCHEQGLGDAIQFARFIPLLAAQGARVLLGVPPALARLMAGVTGVAQVLSADAAVPSFDLKCLLLSAAQRLGVNERSLCAGTFPYVSVPEASVSAWRARLAAASGGGRRLHIGVAVSGNPAHAADAQRSMALERLLPVLHALGATTSCRWHLLQKELRAQDAPVLAEAGIVDHRDELHDLADTAALIACLDAVVSVDTAVAHLAGALGVPVFLLLAADPDWRWMLDRSDSPWYPSMRLLRQARAGDWATPLAQLELGLGALARSGGGEALARRIDVAPLSAYPRLALRRCKVVQPELPLLLARAAERHRRGERAEAINAYRGLLQYDPELFDAHRLLGAALYQERRDDEAIPVLERALALRPDSAEALQVHAQCLARLGRHAAALHSTDRALALEPGRADLWADRASVLNALARHAEVRQSLERAVALDPATPLYRFQRALARLMLGELPHAWADFEARLEVPELATPPIEGIATWTGAQSLSGKTVLLSCEQGLGDTIQFARFAAPLAARGARVVLGVQRPLRELLRSVPGVSQVVTEGDPLARVDWQCPLLSLAYHLRTTLETIPSVPYLRASPERRAHWRARLGAGGASAPQGRRIGIACSGNALHFNDRYRSLGLEQLSALAGADVQWHLLQTDLPARDEPWLARLGIVDHRAHLRDFADTAALVACLDAVVSVDTSVAHLAGAMGVPLFLLLPANPDWRWLPSGEDSPWYPGARLLRQQALGDWDLPLERLAQALASVAVRRPG